MNSKPIFKQINTNKFKLDETIFSKYQETGDNLVDGFLSKYNRLPGKAKPAIRAILHVLKKTNIKPDENVMILIKGWLNQTVGYDVTDDLLIQMFDYIANYNKNNK